MRFVVFLLFALPCLAIGQDIQLSYYELGMEKAKRQDYYGAVKQFTFSIEASTTKGKALYKTGPNGEKVVVDERQSLGMAYYGRGSSYTILEKYKEAVQDFHLALEEGVENNKLRFRLGFCLSKINRHGKAVSNYTRVIFNDPSYPDIFLHRAISWHHLGDHVASLKDFERVYGKAPKGYDVHYLQGISKVRLGMHQNAIDSFDRALFANPDHIQANFEKAKCYQVLGKLSVAASLMEKLISDEPLNAQWHEFLAQIYYEQSKFSNSLVSATRSLELAPQSGKVYELRGKIHTLKGMRKEAINDFGRAKSIYQNRKWGRDVGRVDKLIKKIPK